jgi:hypothetical protein
MNCTHGTPGGDQFCVLCLRAECDRLAAQLVAGIGLGHRALALLLKLSPPYDDGSSPCPVCEGRAGQGHDDGCEWGEIAAEAKKLREGT